MADSGREQPPQGTLATSPGRARFLSTSQHPAASIRPQTPRRFARQHSGFGVTATSLAMQSPPVLSSARWWPATAALLACLAACSKPEAPPPAAPPLVQTVKAGRRPVECRPLMDRGA